MTAVIFTPTPGGRYSVRFAYDPAVVSLIKGTIPGYARSWSAQSRVWYVDTDWTDVLATELRRHGHTVTGLNDPSNRQHAADSAGWARAVFHRVGPNRAPLAYKLLSRLCHPDHGGDHQLQVELNQAFGELSTERKTA